jgi:hypothetical protein
MKKFVWVIIVAVAFLSLGFYLVTYGNKSSEKININYGISLSTDKMSYSIGETINMALKVFNYTEEDVVFYFNTSQRYDFIIEDVEGNEVWRWSKDRMFAMGLGEEVLGATNTDVIYTEKYNDKLSPGYYKITGILVTKNRPMSGSIIIGKKQMGSGFTTSQNRKSIWGQASQVHKIESFDSGQFNE